MLAEGQYVWYSVEIRATEPPEVGVIEVEARVRGGALIVSVPDWLDTGLKCRPEALLRD